MFRKVLLQLREKIRKREYIMSLHARKEMHADGFSIFDVESGILSGQILERQKDLLTGESKYRVRGKTILNREIEIISKISPTNKLVVITVYEP